MLCLLGIQGTFVSTGKEKLKMDVSEAPKEGGLVSKECSSLGGEFIRLSFCSKSSYKASPL